VYGVSGGDTQRTYVDDWKLMVIPEPASGLLLGLAGLALGRRR